MDDFEIELKKDFLTESVDLLGDAESAFLALEKERDNPELLNKIFRVAHNLKGTSKAVGFEQLGELTHSAENLILKLKEGKIKVTDSAVTVLLVFKDKITEMIEGLKDDLEAKFDISEAKLQIENLIEGKGESASAPSDVPSSEAVSNEAAVVEDAPIEKNNECASVISVEAIKGLIELGEPLPSIILMLEESGLDKDAVQQFLKEAGVEHGGEGIKKSVASAPVKEVAAPAPAKEASTAAAPPKSAAKEDDTIRVKLATIDKLNNLVGELVILQTVLSQRKFKYIQDDLANKSIGQMSKLFKEVQDLSMSLRMIPLKATFQKMTRIVRDTSQALNRKVELHLKGEETEVDKTVLEGIADPLVHIVRNAIDHGLETPEERLAVGKSPEGNVEILAFYEGNTLAIQVTDDGRGLNLDKLRAKAIQKGIISADAVLSDKDATELIFAPGFSTKEQVTEVSGRGVGMDVVKTNITKLGGEVKILSKLGEGSSIKIVLPLTLAVIEGMIIKAGTQNYVVPLGQVFELVKLDKKKIEEFSGGGEFFRLRNEVLPVFDLNKKLNVTSKRLDHSVIIVVRGLRYSFGICIDAVLNQQQIVVKKLGKEIKNNLGIMGSAIMGDGRPALILDLFELYRNDLKESEAFKHRPLKSA